MSDVLWNYTRKEWQPNNPAPNTDVTLAPDTISRCLSLSNLEPLVKQFISDGIDRQDRSVLGEGAIEALQRNMADEDKHELALTRVKQSLIDFSSTFEVEADQIINQWADLPDHPITKAAVLENGVFFIVLPLYSLFGSASLRVTANSISADEVIHVKVHRQAAKLLKAKPSTALNKLRQDTVAWLSKDLSEANDPKWTQDRCLRNSASLMTRGISDMLETQVATVMAPFEVKNTTLDVYA
jgi:hypothetical protein